MSQRISPKGCQKNTLISQRSCEPGVVVSLGWLLWSSRFRWYLLCWLPGWYQKHILNATLFRTLSCFMGNQKAKHNRTFNGWGKHVVDASFCAQLLWIKQQLEDFGIKVGWIPIMCENTSVVNMAKNLVQHKRTKYIDVCHHFLRDNVEKGHIIMAICSTTDQVAGIFIKSLGRRKFQRNRLALGP